MNSCITGFIQYKPTNNITNKLNKSKAPPNKNGWVLDELFSVESWTNAWKFWFIFQYKIWLSYRKTKKIEAPALEQVRSFYLFKI